MNNGQGIAGIGFSAQLLVAKVVRSDGTISPEAEAKAIRWAVDQGARVINLSFGGMRDPRERSRDTYSALEAAAVEYAVSKGVLVVAAVGNADGAPEEPWSYAELPGGAAARRGRQRGRARRLGAVVLESGPSSTTTSPRPGEEDLLDAAARDHVERPTQLLLQGYSDCGPVEFRRGEGTSFSAPQVVAAAALFSSAAPQLQAGSGRDAADARGADAEPDTGCRRCYPGRDALTGWGMLDIARRSPDLNGDVPAADRFEANDEAGERGVGSGAARASGPTRRSTTGTTRWTSTASSFGAASDWWRGSGPARGEHESLPLEARNPAGRRVRSRSSAARRPVQVARLGRADSLACAGDRLVLPRGQGVDAGSRQVLAQIRKARASRRRAEQLFLGTSRICRAGLPTTTARARDVPDDDRARADVRPPRRSRLPGRARRLRRCGRRGGSSGRAAARAASPSVP